jgi:hypothetical protein
MISDCGFRVADWQKTADRRRLLVLVIVIGNFLKSLATSKPLDSSPNLTV